jgi:flagellum-specific peptidoglycan hydrolase FlgJ
MGGLLALVTLAVIGGSIYMAETASVSTSDKLAFVRTFGPVVAQAVRSMGWPTGMSVILVAWAAMESNYGKSKLAVDCFNLFGVKAGPTWQKEHPDKMKDYPTNEWDAAGKQYQIHSYFRCYGSYTESLADLLNMLKITDVYKAAYAALARGDANGFLNAIQASGFSTAANATVNYADRIASFTGEVESLVA